MDPQVLDIQQVLLARLRIDGACRGKLLQNAQCFLPFMFFRAIASPVSGGQLEKTRRAPHNCDGAASAVSRARAEWRA